jgi:hypothetical protein
MTALIDPLTANDEIIDSSTFEDTELIKTVAEATVEGMWKPRGCVE